MSSGKLVPSDLVVKLMKKVYKYIYILGIIKKII